MYFELSRELKAASSVVAAAKKDSKLLAEVGVTAKEIAEAKKALDAVLAQRKALGAKQAGWHGNVRDRHSLMSEGKTLISRVKRRVALALKWDLAEDAEVKDKAGIGGRINFTAEDIAHAARNLAEAAVDPRWAKAMKRRGVTATHAKQLTEIATSLEELTTAPGAGETGLPAELATLLRLTSYLRQSAATVLHVGSARYLPYRNPTYTGKKAAPPAPGQPVAN